MKLCIFVGVGIHKGRDLVQGIGDHLHQTVRRGIGSCRNSLTGWKRFFHVRPVFKNATGTVLAHAELPLIDSGRFTLILPEGQRIDLPHETPLPDSLNDELKLIVSAFRQNSLGVSSPDDSGDD